MIKIFIVVMFSSLIFLCCVSISNPHVTHTYGVNYIILNHSSDTLGLKTAKQANNKTMAPDSGFIIRLSTTLEDEPGSDGVGFHLFSTELDDLSDTVSIMIQDSIGNYSTVCDSIFINFDTTRFPILSKLPYHKEQEPELLYVDTFVVTDSLLAVCRK